MIFLVFQLCGTGICSPGFKLMRASWNIFPSPRSIRIIAWDAVPENYGGQRLCLASPFPGSSTVPVTEQVSLNVCWTQPNKRIMFGFPVQHAFCHLPTSSVTGSEFCNRDLPFLSPAHIIRWSLRALLQGTQWQGNSNLVMKGCLVRRYSMSSLM